MKSLIKQKQSLQKQLNHIEKELEAEIISRHYPALKKKYEGKCFKISNGYSSDERWWLFVKVTEVKPEDVYDTGINGVTSRYRGYTFQTTTSKQIEINMKESGYVHSLGNEITQDEFEKEWNKMINQLNRVIKL